MKTTFNLRAIVKIAALASASIALSGCVYDLGLGYASDGYYDDADGCDPYSDYDRYYDCDIGYGFNNIGYGGGWYDNYYYPGYGFFLFDNVGRRYPMRDQHRRYWGEKRHNWYRENRGRGDRGHWNNEGQRRGYGVGEQSGGRRKGLGGFSGRSHSNDTGLGGHAIVVPNADKVERQRSGRDRSESAYRREKRGNRGSNATQMRPQRIRQEASASTVEPIQRPVSAPPPEQSAPLTRRSRGETEHVRPQ